MTPCPNCGCRASKAVDGDDVESGYRRRRECTDCGHRWSTIEFDVARVDTGEAAVLRRNVKHLVDELSEAIRPPSRLG